MQHLNLPFLFFCRPDKSKVMTAARVSCMNQDTMGFSVSSQHDFTHLFLFTRVIHIDVMSICQRSLRDKVLDQSWEETHVYH